VVFLGFSIIAKTAIQKSPVIGINTRVVIQPNVYYTCPAGKVARVKGHVVCTGLGAAAQARFLINGVIVYRWESFILNQADTTVQNTEFQVNTVGTKNETPVGGYRTFDFTLNAGEDFSTGQSSGTNSEFNVFAVIEESPA